MKPLYYILASLITSIFYLIKYWIKENNKLKRIKALKKLDASKIKAIGEYEKKYLFWSKLKK